MSRGLFSLRGAAVLASSPRIRDKALATAYRYWRRRGFPHYRLTREQTVAQYRTLERTDPARLWAGVEVQLSPVALPLANMFQRHIWSVPVYKSLTRRFLTPQERFADSASFNACLARALRIWPERFSFRPSTVRRALTTYPNTGVAANFRPTAALAIYRSFSAELDPVLDFSAGFGGRLLGALAGNRHYVGIDVASANIRGMRRMTHALRALSLTRARPALLHGAAEELMPTLPANSFQLVFSSPPYFSRERYGGDSRQSWLMYPTYDEWKHRFLRLMIAEAERLLDGRGYLVLNLADPFGLPIVRDALEFAADGFMLEQVRFLRLGALPYTRRRVESAFKLEPVLVLRKRPGARRLKGRSRLQPRPALAPL